MNTAKEADRSDEKRARISYRLLYGGNDGGTWTRSQLQGEGERKPDHGWESVGEKTGAGAQTLLQGVGL